MLKENILKWNKARSNNILKEKLKNEEDLKNLNQEIIKKGIDNEKYIKEKELLPKKEDILAKEEIF